jgi:hypothetical protein
MPFYHTSNFKFPKTGREVICAASAKIAKLTLKIGERKKHVRDQAKALGLESVEDALLKAENLGMNLSVEDSIVHTKMLNNREKARAEQEELEKLEILVRNLPEDAEINLDFDTLEYFGF